MQQIETELYMISIVQWVIFLTLQVKTFFSVDGELYVLYMSSKMHCNMYLGCIITKFHRYSKKRQNIVSVQDRQHMFA